MNGMKTRRNPFHAYRTSRINNHGFTLLELLVVLFVISVVSAIVLPNFTLKEGGIRKDARKVASILRYMNETAALKKQTLHIKFDLDKGRLSWEGHDGRKTQEMRRITAVEMQSRGVVKEGELIVFFSPQGLDEYLWVYLEHDDSKITVAFNPISGRAKII
jgi:prepilin-type N-terminal cleavage/methylation domain-containing protein